APPALDVGRVVVDDVDAAAAAGRGPREVVRAGVGVRSVARERVPAVSARRDIDVVLGIRPADVSAHVGDVDVSGLVDGDRAEDLGDVLAGDRIRRRYRRVRGAGGVEDRAPGTGRSAVVGGGEGDVVETF